MKLLLATLATTATLASATCSDDWCASRDCWAGTRDTPCSCSHGRARLVENRTQIRDGVEWFKYTCCENDPLGPDRSGRGVQCGDWEPMDCSQERCTSPGGSEEYDCWAGKQSEPCPCSQGAANLTGEEMWHNGNKYYEYECCTSATIPGDDTTGKKTDCGEWKATETWDEECSEEWCSSPGGDESEYDCYAGNAFEACGCLEGAARVLERESDTIVKYTCCKGPHIEDDPDGTKEPCGDFDPQAIVNAILLLLLCVVGCLVGVICCVRKLCCGCAGKPTAEPIRIVTQQVPMGVQPGQPQVIVQKPGQQQVYAAQPTAVPAAVVQAAPATVVQAAPAAVVQAAPATVVQAKAAPVAAVPMM